MASAYWARASLYLAIGLLAIANFAPAAVAQKQLSKHAAKELKKQSKREADAMSRFSERASALLANSPVAKGSWGLLIVDAQSGKTLFERDADRYFLPASNMKLFSTALALAKLGPEYRFHTTVETYGVISGTGVLSGDLILVGRGDANLSNRKFPYELKEEFDGAPDRVLAELADAVAAKGIKQISGDVVGDDSYFPRERYPSGWEIDDMVWEYGAAISALAVNDNVVTVTLVPGENPGDPVAGLMPETPDFFLKNETVTSAAGVKADLTLTREPGAAVVVIRGTLPAKSTSRKLQLAIEEPAQHAAALFKKSLEERGIMISGVARAVHEPGSVLTQRAILAEHLSLPLAADIILTNKISQNLHAELLLRTAARQISSWNISEDLVKFAGDFYVTAGIAPGDVVQTDGSGLSEHDLVTPRAVVTLLSYARTQPWFPVYHASLPVSGVDGTLTERMKTPPTLGRIHAKTGSLDHVRTLSGYAETLDGRVLIFSFLGNAQTGKNHEATDAIDGLCRAMVEEFSDKTRADTKKNHRN
ncbi:MAG TPA: D-alanyl-D-alanine carboxypeptidase/D-alanyl-D-alanine-endopeptidase [Candidatus Dormibacteraeota bacterium]|nr:D-alanyl-D-alanine carboxypeptidase/D-alanyl-D-alanine-endopeptidase [Candidatus Dormibacteraeota bacterium]